MGAPAAAMEVGETEVDVRAENSCASDDVDGIGSEGKRGGKADESTLSLNPDLAIELVVDMAEGGGELSMLPLLTIASPVVNARGRWNSSEPGRR